MSDLFPLHLKAAETSRRGKRLVGPVNLSLDGDGVSVLMGPNGSGKTSLLRMMHGAARLTAGSIVWNCDTEAARRAQAFVFQRPVMLRRTVLENLIYPLVVRGMSRAAAKDAARIWAERTGLTNLLQRAAPALSGGEQQKLALARALITTPKLVFLDEPTAALDGRTTRAIEDILRQTSLSGTRLILSTHDIGQARRLADQIVFLHEGHVVETGPAGAFFDAPSTAQARAFLRGDIVE